MDGNEKAHNYYFRMLKFQIQERRLKKALKGKTTLTKPQIYKSG